jgi:uncharacterized membrane protein
MTRGTKELVVGLLGVTGLVFLLLGLFTEAWGFGVGLVVAIGIWAVSGLLARFWNVPKWNAQQDRRTRTEV